MNLPKLPERIICLTEEAVELLYLLGEEHRIVGVSAFAVRPKGVKEAKPTVSVFTHASQKKIEELKPDLIIGYSDIQKDIARDLIEKGHNVYVANHRSLDEVLNYCAGIAHWVGAGEKFNELAKRWHSKRLEIQNLTKDKPSFKVYLEEWDEPRISGIRYFSELVEECGAEDINRHLRDGFLAKERFPEEEHILKENPDVILACWCGKKVDIESFKKRPGWQDLKAIKNNQIYELPPEIFLQPGPALFEEGYDYLMDLFKKIRTP